MKKILYPVLILAAALPLLFACEPVPDTDPDFPDPKFVSYAGHLSLESTKPAAKASGTVLTKAANPRNIVSVELTESGMYVIGFLDDNTSELTYKTGTYTMSGNDYLLSGYGTLSFDNSKSGPVSLTFRPDGASALVIPAVFEKPTGTNKAYRTWDVEKTRVTAKGWVTVSADFIGCNLAEIATFLRNNSHKAPTDVPNRSIKTITLTGTDRMILGYSDGYADLTEFSLSGNVLTYKFNDGMKSFTFETDQAIIEYENSKCLLTINGRIRNSTTSGSVAFVLTPSVEK